MSSNGNGKHPRSSKIQSDTPRFLNLSPPEHNWIRTIPDYYPDILRAPAVTFKADRDIIRVQSNTYVAFARPYRGKQGLLILGSDKRPIIIDETQTQSPQVLPMRLDREAIQGTWIFAITIYTAEGIIQIEDCIVADSHQIRSTKTFNERFSLIQKFSDTIWFQDLRFQLNWQIKVATIYPLSDIRGAVAQSEKCGGCLCLMPDLPSLRLIKVLPQAIVVPTAVGGPSEYICCAVEGKPDVYDIKNGEGKNLGRASIQTLSISLALQQKYATGMPLRVMAEWNEEFESYIVTSVL